MEGVRYSYGYDKVLSLFSSQIAAGTVSVSISRSVDFLNACKENSFDFIYIDTDHTYRTTIEELRASSCCISLAGFIAGHDYVYGNIITPLIYGFIQAVNQFCMENNYRFEYLSVEPNAWDSFCLRKIKTV